MKRNLSPYIDKALLILLTIQLAVVSLSIAVSSIAFGCWIGLWLIQIFTDKGRSGINRFFPPELKLINVFIALYIFLEILSRFFAIYPEGAFDNLKRMLLFLIFFITIIKVPDYNTLIKVLMVVLISNSLISIYELIQYTISFSEMISKMPFSEIRIDYFNYPLTGAEIKMMLFLSILPLLFAKEPYIVPRKLLVAMLVPIFISMMLTQSRNVYLALAICFLIYGIISNRKFLLAFLCVIILAGAFLPSEFTDRIRSIADVTHSSNESRINMWRVGIEMFKDYPLTGVADSHIKEIYETYKKIETPGEGVHLHSNFIMILATTGIFGFLSFLGIFIAVFIKQIQFYKRVQDNNSRMLILGSILVMISFHVSGIFEWSFGDHEVVTIFFFLIAVPFVAHRFSVKS